MNEILSGLKKSAITKGARYQALLAQGNELTSNELKEAGDLAAELKEIKAKVDVYRDSEEVKSWLSGDNPFNLSPKNAGTAEVDANGRVVSGVKGLTDDQLNLICSKHYADVFMEYTRKGRDGVSDFKTLQEGADGSGGFLVPEQIQLELTHKKPGSAGVQDKVRQVQTSRDNLNAPFVSYSTDDQYTSGVRLTKTGEIPASATTANITDPTFAMVRIDVHTFMANATVSKDMIEDSLFDMTSYLADEFRRSVRLQTENYIINGTGVGQPVGLLAAPGTTLAGKAQPAVINSGIDSSNRLLPDGLVTLAYSLPEQYDNEGACFVMNKVNTARSLFSMKDTNGRYLFGYGYGDSGLAGAKPKELLGYEYIYSSQMPNGYTTNGASGSLNSYPIIFGDLRGYWMVTRSALSIQVLDQTKATLNQVEMVGRYRFGGATVEDYKIKVLKVAA